MQGHLSAELFRAIHQGWRNPGDLAAIAMAHLFELCPRCRQEFEGWRDEVREDASPERGRDYDAVIDGIRASEASARDGEAHQDPRHREAESRAEELLRLPPEQQTEWIRSEASKHTGLLLAEALIEECRRRTPGFPHEGVTLANLARLVLQHAPTSVEATQLYARALAWLANAFRVIGDFLRADQILGDARYFLRSQGGGDRLQRAELDRLEGTLLTSQFRARQAVSVLLRAQMAYRMQELPNEAAATLLLLAKAHRNLDELARSSQLLSEAEEILKDHPSARLLMILGDARAMLPIRSGCPAEAMKLLEDVEELRSCLGDPLAHLRGRWLRARAQRASGEPEAAEESYLQASKGFAARSISDDVARIRIELARLYIWQGRLLEAQALTKEAESIFENNQLRGKVAECRRLRARANMA